MTTKKLTRPQGEVLLSLGDGEWRSFSASYPPVKALLALGMIECKQAKYGGFIYHISASGRSALSTPTKEPPHE